MARGREVVAPGQTIASDWGNDVWDQSVQSFTSAADRTAQWPNPSDGAVTWLDDIGQLQVYRDGLWRGIAGNGQDPLTWMADRGGSSDNFGAGQFLTMVQVDLPADAPAGEYLAAFELNWALAEAASSVGYVRNLFGALNLSRDMRVDHGGQAIHTSYTARVVHPGGAVLVQVQAQTATVTGTVFSPGTSVTVAYLG